MNFKQFSQTINLFPSSSAQSYTDKGLTFSCDGNGTYHVEGTPTEAVSCAFDIPTFTIPLSIGEEGNGVIYFFNTNSGLPAITIEVLYNGERKTYWSLNILNRVMDSYSLPYDGVTTGIKINIPNTYIGRSMNFDIKPMITNTGNIETEFIPHMIWHDLTQHIMSTTWQDGSTYSRSGGSWSSSLTKKRSRKRK